jgi:hypothetical protein
LNLLPNLLLLLSQLRTLFFLSQWSSDSFLFLNIAGPSFERFSESFS